MVVCLAHHICFSFHSCGINNIPIVSCPSFSVTTCYFLCFDYCIILLLLPFLSSECYVLLSLLCAMPSLLLYVLFYTAYELRYLSQGSFGNHLDVGVNTTFLWVFGCCWKFKTNTFCSRHTPRLHLILLKHCLEVLYLSYTTNAFYLISPSPSYCNIEGS